MFRQITSWLHNRKLQRERAEAWANTYKAITQRWEDARRLMEEASERGDTRDYGRAYMIARQASHDLLRMEGGR